MNERDSQAWCFVRSFALLDESKDHSVEVVEKAEEIKAKLDEALFLVVWEGAENLGRIVHVILVPDFIDIENEQWRVEQEGRPLTRQ